MSDMYSKEWKVAECGCTKDCWCSLVATVDYDPNFKGTFEERDAHENGQIIIGSGEVNHEKAAHIVMCHNFYLQKSRMIEDGQETNQKAQADVGESSS